MHDSSHPDALTLHRADPSQGAQGAEAMMWTALRELYAVRPAGSKLGGIQTHASEPMQNRAVTAPLDLVHSHSIHTQYNLHAHSIHALFTFYSRSIHIPISLQS